MRNAFREGASFDVEPVEKMSNEGGAGDRTSIEDFFFQALSGRSDLPKQTDYRFALTSWPDIRCDEATLTELTLDEHTVHLYGLPGQQRFAFMRDILVPGSFGVVLLLDASSDEIYGNASDWLTSLRGLDSKLKFAIGVTKTELEKSGAFSLNQLRGVVREHTPTAPVLSVDARSAQDIKQLIRVLLQMK